MIQLLRLIAEATVLAGGKHVCEQLGHRWKSMGGRACPFHEDGCGEANSQAAEQCESCELIDYGTEPGLPGYDWCASRGFNCGGYADADSVALVMSRHKDHFVARVNGLMLAATARDPHNPPIGELPEKHQ